MHILHAHARDVYAFSPLSSVFTHFQPKATCAVRTSLHAGLSAADVAGLQLHGTGTALGDPIEVGAASGLLLEGRPASAPFTLLASKSALGHSEPASGIMGLAFLHQVSSQGAGLSAQKRVRSRAGWLAQPN